jgi:hypothetical protein
LKDGFPSPSKATTSPSSTVSGGSAFNAPNTSGKRQEKSFLFLDQSWTPETRTNANRSVAVKLKLILPDGTLGQLLRGKAKHRLNETHLDAIGAHDLQTLTQDGFMEFGWNHPAQRPEGHAGDGVAFVFGAPCSLAGQVD